MHVQWNFDGYFDHNIVSVTLLGILLISLAFSGSFLNVSTYSGVIFREEETRRSDYTQRWFCDSGIHYKWHYTQYTQYTVLLLPDLKFTNG